MWTIFWYRNRARKDYYVQGWKPRRIYADFIVTLRGDEPGADDGFHQVFVVETKGVHLRASEDTEYKRSVVDIWQRACSQGRLGRVRTRDAEQGDALRGRGRGRVASAAERDAVRRSSVKELGERTRRHRLPEGEPILALNARRSMPVRECSAKGALRITIPRSKATEGPLSSATDQRRRSGLPVSTSHRLGGRRRSG